MEPRSETGAALDEFRGVGERDPLGQGLLHGTALGDLTESLLLRLVEAPVDRHVRLDSLERYDLRRGCQPALEHRSPPPDLLRPINLLGSPCAEINPGCS